MLVSQCSLTWSPGHVFTEMYSMILQKGGQVTNSRNIAILNKLSYRQPKISGISNRSSQHLKSKLIAINDYHKK